MYFDACKTNKQTITETVHLHVYVYTCTLSTCTFVSTGVHTCTCTCMHECISKYNVHDYMRYTIIYSVANQVLYVSRGESVAKRSACCLIWFPGIQQVHSDTHVHGDNLREREGGREMERGRGREDEGERWRGRGRAPL